MIYEDFYLRDDMNISGRTTKSLLEAATIMDENTTIESLEFTDCQILHYFDYYAARNELQVAAITPARQLLVSSQVEGPGVRKGIPTILGPRIARLNLDGMRKDGALCLAEEMVEDPEVNGTVFFFDENSRLPMYLFVSGVCAKTMGSRLSVNTSKSSLERDIFLAKNIGDLDSLHPLYVVMRGTGIYRKAIAMFANDPERVPFSQTVQSLSQYKEGSCVYWHMEQKYGLTALFTFQGLEEIITKDFSDFPYRPMVGINLCDSGHISQKFFAGWYLPTDPGGQCFITHEIPYEASEYGLFQTCTKLTEKCITALKEDVKQILSWKKDNKNVRENVDVDFYTKQVERFATRANFIVAGAKAKRQYIEYAISHYKGNEPSKYELFSYLLEACRQGIFQRLSAYADQKIRSNVFVSLFQT